ncbi:19878_t:CDS:2, partial [Racocetra persica]
MQYITQPIVGISSGYIGGFQVAENTYRIRITRNIKEIIRNNFQNDLGLVPNLVKLPYITSTRESVPITNSSAIQNSLIELNFEPQSFIVQVQTDKRLKTVLNSLGLLGGAFGLAISLLVLLFGNNTINPWGFVQRHNKAMQTNLITFSELIPNNSDNEMSIQELRQKLNLLQLLLGDYLVDAEYLEKIQQLEMKSSKE